MWALCGLTFVLAAACTAAPADEPVLAPGSPVLVNVPYGPDGVRLRIPTRALRPEAEYEIVLSYAATTPAILSADLDPAPAPTQAGARALLNTHVAVFRASELLRGGGEWRAVVVRAQREGVPAPWFEPPDSVAVHVALGQRVAGVPVAAVPVACAAVALAVLAFAVAPRLMRAVVEPPKRPRSAGADAPTTEIGKMFALMSTELDAQARPQPLSLSPHAVGANRLTLAGPQHDLYERLVKRSRDLTIASKRLIFKIAALFADLGQNPYARYQRASSPGMQEFVEASTLAWYVGHGTLQTLQQINDEVARACGNSQACVSREDYLLGVADMTGEVMRNAINAAGEGDHQTVERNCAFLRDIFEGYTVIPEHNVWGLAQKIEVMRSSVSKVEQALFEIKVHQPESAIQ
eukprot:m51a1_g841 hypothetical protein (407) ;mRNA; r:765186-766865